MRKLTLLAAGVLLAISALGVAAAEVAKPLFAGDSLIHIVVRGPILAVAHKAARSTEEVDATVSVAGETQVLPIKLSARGRTRRQAGICEFPPLRLTFPDKPGAGSLFEGQKKLKLVTHCQPDPAFQQFLLLESSAYRIYNLLTPLSFRARLAQVDYVEANGRPLTSRFGFLLEDAGDVARRNGLREAKLGDHVGRQRLDAVGAGRVAVFEYMIGNLDWSMVASPKGEDCCHNIKLVASEGASAGFAPAPYDYDGSGLVDAPYAVPPAGVGVETVRERRYRGYCMHNAEARVAIAELQARRGEVLGVLDGVPQLTATTRRKAQSYLADFFERTATEGGVDRILKTCIA